MVAVYLFEAKGLQGFDCRAHIPVGTVNFRQGSSLLASKERLNGDA